MISSSNGGGEEEKNGIQTTGQRGVCMNMKLKSISKSKSNLTF